MLDRNIPHLDAAEIARDRAHWRPISREMALSGWRNRPVAVIHRGPGRDTATLFQPANRFFRTDGPYLYDALRYFLYTGHFEPFGLKKSLGLASKPPETEFEAMDAFDVGTGEFLSLGSPSAKVPGKPPLPKDGPPALPKIPASPQAPGFQVPKIPEIPEIPEIPDIPGDAQIPEIPSIPEIPDPPTLKEFTIPKLPGIPEAPALTTLAAPPELALEAATENDPESVAAVASPVPKEKLPIEIQLLGLDEKPMPNTAFRLNLPDGTVKEGQSDSEGFIRFPDNELKGEMELVLPEFAES